MDPLGLDVYPVTGPISPLLGSFVFRKRDGQLPVDDQMCGEATVCMWTVIRVPATSMFLAYRGAPDVETSLGPQWGWNSGMVGDMAGSFRGASQGGREWKHVKRDHVRTHGWSVQVKTCENPHDRALASRLADLAMVNPISSFASGKYLKGRKSRDFVQDQRN